MFQPTKFFNVPPERLKEWEQLLKERVGIPKSIEMQVRANGSHVTCCPDCDDCG
jgi:hypothetical protein